MPGTPSRQRPVVRVLFDESHGEAWSIRAASAAALRPEHPAAACYGDAAAALAESGFEVVFLSSGPFDEGRLAGSDVIVIAQPADARFARTPGGPPRFTAAELEAVTAFVARGGGLLVLAEAEQDKYGANLDELLAPFGIRIRNTVVRDYTGGFAVPTHVPAEPAARADATSAVGQGLLQGVARVCMYRAGAVEAVAPTPDAPPATIVLRSGAQASPAQAGLLAAAGYGAGRVAVVSDSDLFGDDHLGSLDHRQLWLNLAYWVAQGAFRTDPAPIASAAADDPAWLELRDQTNALRALQGPKGEVTLEPGGVAAVQARVDAIVGAIAALAPRFPHQTAYLEQLPVDFREWFAGGCARPDFSASLALFRPERERRDGVEHLVVFPMYTPNHSLDVRFEALITRTPWPPFVAEMAEERFDNDKFVPVELVDFTAGYDGECAVLFPETVSAEHPSHDFGAIFCDRESARFRRTVDRVGPLLGLELPPDAAALAASPDLSLETYVLWDLIHDRWHSHGELPFDPFMIRQRLPYWMYSLEELRVDLAAYGSAAELVAEGIPFARNVQYAIVLDRLLRFPITGSRVRNYDGLGGQLLFAFLHKKGIVTWGDNRLRIDWEHADEAVAELRGRIAGLYRAGIDMSKVTYWAAAHDLVAEWVPPNVLSQWARFQRVVSAEDDPRAWIDRVMDDEFPLSTFYLQLQKRLAEQEGAR